MSEALSLRKNAFFDRLVPSTGLPEHAGHEPNYHLISLLIILSLDWNTRVATFPENGPVDPTKLFHDYGDVLDLSVITADHVKALSPYRDAFVGVKAAWAAFGDYNPEPCPAIAAIKALAVATQHLPGSAGPLQTAQPSVSRTKV